MSMIDEIVKNVLDEMQSINPNYSNLTIDFHVTTHDMKSVKFAITQAKAHADLYYEKNGTKTLISEISDEIFLADNSEENPNAGMD